MKRLAALLIPFFLSPLASCANRTAQDYGSIRFVEADFYARNDYELEFVKIWARKEAGYRVVSSGDAVPGKEITARVTSASESISGSDPSLEFFTDYLAVLEGKSAHCYKIKNYSVNHTISPAERELDEFSDVAEARFIVGNSSCPGP